MRFYTLLSIQEVILYIIPGLLFVLILGVALSYSHFHSKDSEERKTRIYVKYSEEIEDRMAPFPLFLTLIIAGAVLWAFFYILGTGLLGVKI